MAKKIQKIYWDACCFLAILNNESNQKVCEDVLREAEAGDIQLFISPLTMAETVRPKGSLTPLSLQSKQKVLALFEGKYVNLITFNREVAFQSLEYCWNYGLHPRDALHLAFAVFAGCDAIETTDPDLLNIPTAYPISIQVRRPIGSGQTTIDNFPNEEETTTS